MELQLIQNKIYEIRNQKVMFDYDLAELYQVETKVLNQAVKRNIKRFPERFMFRLTQDEWHIMRSQIVTSSPQLNRKVGFMPFVFTEHGVTMLASVLRSDIAIQMNIAIVEAFISLKEFALNYSELTTKIKELENRFDQSFSDITEAINYLLQKDDQQIEQGELARIGFKKAEE